MELVDQEYKKWLLELKHSIRATRIKAAIAVNKTLIEFYWELGKRINEKQTQWGTHFLENLSKDLRAEFPEMQGFSVTNLKYCKLLYGYLSIRPQAGDELEIAESPRFGDELAERDLLIRNPALYELIIQLPWGHIKELIAKVKNRTEAIFYITQSLENSWGRDAMAWQIKSDLYGRTGNAITNFKKTMPDPLSDLAQQTLKDPYVFDFMSITKPYREKDIENQLIKHIKKFLLELGKGFAFVGQQYHLEVGGNDYYLDLLFYHTRLKCYTVVELKNTRFIPEYTGKLNFYLSAVDSLVKQPEDNPTIGILLCRDKNNIEAEFALRDINKPMGVSRFEIIENLPDNLKSSLPTIEELEQELGGKEME